MYGQVATQQRGAWLHTVYKMNAEHSRKQIQAHVANMKRKSTDLIYTTVIVILILDSRSVGDIRSTFVRG